MSTFVLLILVASPCGLIAALLNLAVMRRNLRDTRRTRNAWRSLALHTLEQNEWLVTAMELAPAPERNDP